MTSIPVSPASSVRRADVEKGAWTLSIEITTLSGLATKERTLPGSWRRWICWRVFVGVRMNTNKAGILWLISYHCRINTAIQSLTL